jgi:peptide/nickel transport system substrate-binding protein
VQTQVFPYLVNTDYNSNEVVPDLAESAEFTSPNEYTVKLPAGLKWANGHDLTSSDVKFSFDRNLKIADPNGASSLLYNLDSVSTPDATTVVFKLKTDNDQVFPFILTSFPGAIVDEEVFSADAVTPDQDIVKADAFGGPTRSRSGTSTRRSSSRRTRTTRVCSPRRATRAPSSATSPSRRT